MSGPTDLPVLGRDWVALRNLQAGSYALWRCAAGGFSPTGPTQVHVTDDHGDLVPLGHELQHARWTTWTCSEDFEAAGRVWWEERMAQGRREALLAAAARATRALLRPAPVQVQVDTAPDDEPTVAALITIGDDERLRDAASHTPLYRVRCGHEDLTLTHAQLAALMLGAQQLIAGLQRPRGARVQ